eukprot:10262121-Alexandrium_andersonii.AAC.1
MHTDARRRTHASPTHAHTQGRASTAGRPRLAGPRRTQGHVPQDLIQAPVCQQDGDMQLRRTQPGEAL